MAKVFFSEKFILVPASPPHPPNTEYKISIGLETWGGENHRVVKIHMVFDGKVADRRAPSFPVGTSDYTLISEAIRRISASR